MAGAPTITRFQIRGSAGLGVWGGHLEEFKVEAEAVCVCVLE